MSPSSRVWFAVASRRILITCALPKVGRWHAKVSDEFTVPLCRGHHREVHRYGDEAAWWEKTGLDPTVAARALWLETHPMAMGSARLPVGVADPPVAQSTDHMNPERDRRVSGRRAGRKSKTGDGAVSHDVA